MGLGLYSSVSSEPLMEVQLPSELVVIPAWSMKQDTHLRIPQEGTQIPALP